MKTLLKCTDGNRSRTLGDGRLALCALRKRPFGLSPVAVDTCPAAGRSNVRDRELVPVAFPETNPSRSLWLIVLGSGAVWSVVSNVARLARRVGSRVGGVLIDESEHRLDDLVVPQHMGH